MTKRAGIKIGIMALVAALLMGAYSVYPSLGLIWFSTTDPTVGPGVPAPLNQFLVRTDTPGVYYHHSTSATDWVLVGGGTTSITNIVNGAISDVFFGGGVDGDINFDCTTTPITGIGGRTLGTLSAGTYTLSSAISAANFSITAGCNVEEAGFPIFISKTWSGAGTIKRDGNDGSGSTGGVLKSGQTLPGDSAGGNGSLNFASSAGTGGALTSAPIWVSATAAAGGNPGTNGGTSHGGGGGGRVADASCTGQGGTGGPGAGGTVSGQNTESVLPDGLMYGRNITRTIWNGTASGGGGGAAACNGGATGPSGGGGGGGGAYVVVVAKTCSSTATVSSRGGNGANGPNGTATGGGGGGGGGGGTVVVFCGSGTLPTTNVAGGTGGSGGSGGDVTRNGFAGGNGGNGVAITRILSAP